MNENTKDIFKRIALFISGMLVFQIASIILMVLGFGQFIYNKFGEAQVDAVLMFVSYLIGLITALVIFGKNNILELLKGFKVSKNIRDGITISIIAIALTTIYSLIVQSIYPITDNNNEVAVGNIIIYNPILSFFTVVIIGPIVEEITYRFGLFGAINKNNKTNKIVAYIVTILIFALIHFDFTARGNQLVIELLNLPSYLIAAGLLSYAYDRGGISCSISAHIFNNLISFIATLIQFYTV